MKRPQVHKTYPGDCSRPTVEVIIHERENILIAATPWGSQEAIKLLNQTSHDYLSASLADHEATSPFAKLPGLTATENHLRTAILISNDAIFQKLNKETYTSSCEAIIMHQHQSELAWVQIGQPNILLLRKNKLFPLQLSFDLSIDYDNPAPLPSRLIGLEKAWDFEVRSLKISEDDALIFLARSLIPQSLFATSLDQLSLEEIIHVLFDLTVADDPRLPFWICVLK